MKILIAAASRHGATQEIAAAIGDTLASEGMEVFVSTVEEAGDPADYDAVILGSGVYMGHWLESATKFVESHSAALSNRPTWLFSSGPIGNPPRPNESQAVDAEALVSKTRAKQHRLFAGKLDKGGLGFSERAVMLAFRATEGDYRNWREIEAWARVIAGELRQT